MMDSTYLANKYGKPISHAGWQDVQRLLDWLRNNWRALTRVSGRFAAGPGSSCIPE